MWLHSSRFGSSLVFQIDSIFKKRCLRKTLIRTTDNPVLIETLVLRLLNGVTTFCRKLICRLPIGLLLLCLLSIGRQSIGRQSIGRLSIDQLSIDQLSIDQLSIDQQRASRTLAQDIETYVCFCQKEMNSFRLYNAHKWAVSEVTVPTNCQSADCLSAKWRGTLQSAFAARSTWHLKSASFSETNFSPFHEKKKKPQTILIWGWGNMRRIRALKLQTATDQRWNESGLGLEGPGQIFGLQYLSPKLEARRA